MQSIETLEAPKGHIIEIYPDFTPENPREWCNLGTLAIRNHAGDEEPDPDFDLSDCIWLPVYRYEHSGIAFNTTGFHCPWDSGQTGYIYVTKADVRKEYGWKRITAERAEKIKSYLRNEVETYSQWANGEVYGFITKDAEGEEIDSCWGFYGFDHEASGLADAAQEMIP